MIRQSLTMPGPAALCLQLGMAPAGAKMSHDEMAATAAAALPGIAALLHGYPCMESTCDCPEGWLAGTAERERSRAHRQNTSADRKAPPMTVKGCANLRTTTAAVGTHAVHILKARPARKHECKTEASLGHEQFVRVMRDTGDVISARGGRLHDQTGMVAGGACTARGTTGQNVDHRESS